MPQRLWQRLRLRLQLSLGLAALARQEAGDQRGRREPIPQKQRPSGPTNGLSPGRENEARVATLCNCGGNGSLDHSNFAHVQLHQICVDAFNVDVGNTDTQHHQNKTFAMWLMDEDHFEDHTMFLISLVFNVSLVMMPVFAWLEADLVLAGIWWLWAGLLALLLIMQSSTWVSFALYSLRWLFPTPPPVGLVRQRLLSPSNLEIRCFVGVCTVGCSLVVVLLGSDETLVLLRASDNWSESSSMCLKSRYLKTVSKKVFQRTVEYYHVAGSDVDSHKTQLTNFSVNITVRKPRITQTRIEVKDIDPSEHPRPQLEGTKTYEVLFGDSDCVIVGNFAKPSNQRPCMLWVKESKVKSIPEH